MYEEMKLLFPLVHSVLALAVNGRRRGSCRVTSILLNVDDGVNDAVVNSAGDDDVNGGVNDAVLNGADDDRVVNGDEYNSGDDAVAYNDAGDHAVPDDARAVPDDAVPDDADSSMSDGGDVGSADLSKRERAILEFFIAKIRLSSQKQMRWWAMIPPIAAYSRGHMHNPPNHPLHGAGCNEITMWSSLDKLYDSTKLARIDLMTHQYTISIAFDNWQQQKAKTWQNQGSSAVFLNGVAAFLKKDKTILLPIKSIIRSPSNVRFRITSRQFLDPYLILVKGVVVGEGDLTEDDAILPSDVTLSRQADINRVTGGMLAWPVVGWDVLFLHGLPRCSELSYVDPVIPPPLHACIGTDVSIDDILFTERDLKYSGETNVRYITSTEYDQLICDAEDISILQTYSRYLADLHQRRTQSIEVAEKATEMTIRAATAATNDDVVEIDDDSDEMCDYLPGGIPHDYDRERLFLGQFEKCSSKVFCAMRFRGDVIRHLYPHSRVEDIYMHPPLIGRNETTTDGMMLTNVALLEILGLLKPIDGGRYSLGKNAHHRRVFMYGDALSVNKHSALHDRIVGCYDISQTDVSQIDLV